MSWGTKALGLAAVATAGSLLGAELRRIWKLGSLTDEEGSSDQQRAATRRVSRMIRIARDGYGVSRARRNAVFNMLVSFTVTLGATRSITVMIRDGVGPFGNVRLGGRHVHHFVPGMVLCLVCGGVALGTRDDRLHAWLAVPFGGGVALVLDETALLLELEDVYWSEEGAVSLRVAFAALALLATMGYLIQFLREGSSQLLESDWRAAARAWQDISELEADEHTFRRVT